MSCNIKIGDYAWFVLPYCMPTELFHGRVTGYGHYGQHNCWHIRSGYQTFTPRCHNVFCTKNEALQMLIKREQTERAKVAKTLQQIDDRLASLTRQLEPESEE